MDKNKMDNLTPWQIELREKAQKLIYRKLPDPWSNYSSKRAAGVFAGGWTQENEFILLSNDGYSVYQPTTGSYAEFFGTKAKDEMFKNLYEEKLEFILPSTEEKVRIFGVTGGDGIHDIEDWVVEVIYPWWPNGIVVMYPDSLLQLETVFPIQLKVVGSGNWIKCGFSPSKDILAILGEAGAEFHAKIDLISPKK
jgi:hypothetical protein